MDSQITISNGATTIEGPDAIECYRAFVLASSLKLYAKTKIIPTRGVTITRMLEMATRYSGVKYKRGQAMEAAEDVEMWAKVMKSALPIIDNRTGA